MFKRLIHIPLMGCLLALACAFPQTAVQLHGQLRVQGNRVVDKNGQAVQLRGMALYWSNGKPAFYNAQCVQWLRDDWRISIVRPSMAVGSLGNTPGYTGSPSAA